MGLDMYLTKKTYIFTDDRKRLVIDGVEGVDPKKVSYIEEEFGYWRKVNAIHKWFVTNVQDGEDDCKDYYVSQEDLRKLLKVVNEVLEDHSKARELLPTSEGFFFGSTDYDELYFSDLEQTRGILERALKEKNANFYYNSSW